MNFYQKIISAVTLAVVGITLSIIFVCFDTPYSGIFITECIAVVWAEVLFGMTLIMLSKKSDLILPYSMAAGHISFAYFLFVLLMIYPACKDMPLKYFILIHSIGFVLTMIVYGIFSLGEHNIKEQESFDKKRLAGKKTFYLSIRKIQDEAKTVFADIPDLLKETERAADCFRYAADSRAGMENLDFEIMNTLQAMQNAVDAADAVAYKQYLNLLLRSYHSREELAQLN